ncbi:hypothetical protein KQX54_020601 [Cotesia glomerata]|uniref:Uncharacterized protein n=1 Tax=Cotesia glomerata TaxID=32391 RepID=A0AAV7I247_COTGL|nr:hypothetical protein KQX54_020601 [Cotesia glomerata]
MAKCVSGSGLAHSERDYNHGKLELFEQDVTPPSRHPDSYFKTKRHFEAEFRLSLLTLCRGQRDGPNKIRQSLLQQN